MCREHKIWALEQGLGAVKKALRGVDWEAETRREVGQSLADEEDFDSEDGETLPRGRKEGKEVIARVLRSVRRTKVVLQGLKQAAAKHKADNEVC